MSSCNVAKVALASSSASGIFDSWKTGKNPLQALISQTTCHYRKQCILFFVCQIQCHAGDCRKQSIRFAVHEFSKQTRYKQNQNFDKPDNKVVNWKLATTIYRLSTELSQVDVILNLPPFRLNYIHLAIFRQLPYTIVEKSQFMFDSSNNLQRLNAWKSAFYRWNCWKLGCAIMATIRMCSIQCLDVSHASQRNSSAVIWCAHLYKQLEWAHQPYVAAVKHTHKHI